VNATPGSASLARVEQIGAAAFDGRVLIDVANASTPAFELVYPNSSLAEQLQAALPGARVVKKMNTAAMAVMTQPASLPPSNVFVSGGDPGAKATVVTLLRDFGWPETSVIDLVAHPVPQPGRPSGPRPSRDRHQAMTATATVLPEPRRSEVYAVQVTRYPRFAEYETRTKRSIPVVALTFHRQPGAGGPR
jgi:F420H(2)-dependent quinone reductase